MLPTYSSSPEDRDNINLHLLRFIPSLSPDPWRFDLGTLDVSGVTKRKLVARDSLRGPVFVREVLSKGSATDCLFATSDGMVGP